MLQPDIFNYVFHSWYEVLHSRLPSWQQPATGLVVRSPHFHKLASSQYYGSYKNFRQNALKQCAMIPSSAKIAPL